MPTDQTIAVLGAGAWGTALSVLFARNGYAVRLWGHTPASIEHIARERMNASGLPGVSLPEAVELVADLGEVARSTTNFVVAVPSHAFRTTLRGFRPALSSDATLAWATKGLEPNSGLLLGDVAREFAGPTSAIAAISGPTFAAEIARGLPAALTVAASDATVAERVATWLRNERVRVYTSEDVVGVQLAGAIKNVMAIAAGISDGLGFGSNARAALITRGLAELMRLGVAMGGKPETFMGLAGAGDLILTCTDDKSRNRRTGLGLGRGRLLADVLREIGQEAEGVATVRELYRLARERGIEMPITEQVYRVLYENLPPPAAVQALFKRDARRE